MATPAPTPPRATTGAPPPQPPFGASPFGSSSGSARPSANPGSGSAGPSYSRRAPAPDSNEQLIGICLAAIAQMQAAQAHLDEKLKVLEINFNGHTVRLDNISEESPIKEMLKRIEALEIHTGLKPSADDADDEEKKVPEVIDLEKRIATLEKAAQAEDLITLARKVAALEKNGSLSTRIAQLEEDHKDAEAALQRINSTLLPAVEALEKRVSSRKSLSSRLRAPCQKLQKRVNQFGHDHKKTLQTITIIVGSIMAAFLIQTAYGFFH